MKVIWRWWYIDSGEVINYEEPLERTYSSEIVYTEATNETGYDNLGEDYNFQQKLYDTAGGNTASLYDLAGGNNPVLYDFSRWKWSKCIWFWK